jgi:hypothetical protein
MSSFIVVADAMLTEDARIGNKSELNPYIFRVQSALHLSAFALITMVQILHNAQRKIPLTTFHPTV